MILKYLNSQVINFLQRFQEANKLRQWNVIILHLLFILDTEIQPLFFWVRLKQQYIDWLPTKQITSYWSFCFFLARRFWNQIVTWYSLRPRVKAKASLRSFSRYGLERKAVSNSCCWYFVKIVLGLNIWWKPKPKKGKIFLS